jgi:small subunit ribosomal protein S1
MVQGTRGIYSGLARHRGENNNIIINPSSYNFMDVPITNSLQNFKINCLIIRIGENSSMDIIYDCLEEQIVSDDFLEKNNGNEESFEKLIDEYSEGIGKELQLGDKVRGRVISIGRDSVYIDTGTRFDGVVDLEELMDNDRGLSCKVGDLLDLYVVSHDKSELRLSKSLSGTGNIMVLEEAFHKAVPVEGKVTGECKGGFTIEVMGKRAFCPISQIDLKYVENPKEYLGESFPFLITQFDEEGRNIVVSRQKLILKEQEKTIQEFLKGVTVGIQLEGRVTKLMPYGAFVELMPGIEGMIHVSEISWSKSDKPDEILKAGDTVEVKIIGIEEGKRPGDTKIALSIKQMRDDPWNSVETEFSIGQKVKGKVTKCAKFGAFVEIAPGIEGLVHLSEMSYVKRVVKAESIVKAGDIVDVMINEIDSENRKISLSIRDAEGDPWIDIQNKYKEGQSVQGTLEKKEKFGFFVSLEPGITGLIPISRINGMHKASAIEKLSEGDSIMVTVDEIKLEDRKITLSPQDATGENDWKSYTQDSGKPIGSFGEKLQQAFRKKTVTQTSQK